MCSWQAGSLDMDVEATRGTSSGPISSDSSPEHRSKWIQIQDSLKGNLITKDDFKWRLPTKDDGEEAVKSGEVLKFVGGVDLSFSRADPSVACGSLVVLDLQTLRVVYEDYSVVRLHIPYIPGFLAFREAPVLLGLLQKMKANSHPFYPEVLMVDGNGLLHPQGFGLACHLGVLADLPTLGVGKNLHHVDGLTKSRVTQLLEATENSTIDSLSLTGDSGCTWGAAMRSTRCSLKPIFISVGHRISLDTAIKIVRMTCKFRIPEPIRQADIKSRSYLHDHPEMHQHLCGQETCKH
ncbi:PREDICTED: endonuclease V [Ipomoea nil]|uniref:endonuclease V n=1 Tax=Ipomoea nil TaxID=35883 RepID=UPI000901FBD5|nr:PREDICTED: endonuclease V [Ipomoea nil]